MEEDAVDDDQDSIERLQNQSGTAGGAKTNIANTIKLNRSDDDEGEGHVTVLTLGRKMLTVLDSFVICCDIAGQFLGELCICLSREQHAIYSQKSFN